MFNYIISFLPLDLQLFAEGAAVGASAAGGGAASVKGGDTSAEGTAVRMPATSKNKNPLADVKYGIQEASEQHEGAPAATAEKGKEAETPETQDRNEKYKAMIEGEYKDLYNASVQEIVKKRLKNSKDIVDKYNKLAPVVDMLGKKYGIDGNDIDAIRSALEDDDAYYEDEAAEKGISVKELKSIKKFERENAELKQQIARENADRIYAEWMRQADSTKAIYPAFELETEMQNPDFVKLVRNNVDVKTAFEVVHKDEIIPAAMQFAANKASQQTVNKIIAKGTRPVENGISAQSPVVVKNDVSQLSKADRDEIIRRVTKGEVIRF